MNYKRILLFLSILMLLGVKAVSQIDTRVRHCTVKITFSIPTYYDYYDSVGLLANGHYFATEIEYNRTAPGSAYVCHGVEPGNYSLIVETIFGDIEIYTIRIDSDTSIKLNDKRKLVSNTELSISDYGKCSNIKIHYKEWNCYHRNGETLLVEKRGADDYVCTLLNGHIAREIDISGKTYHSFILDTQKVYSGPDIADNIFKLVNFFCCRENKANKNAYPSPYAHSILVQADNTLYEFNDWGEFDWGIYQDFVNAYFYDYNYW